MKNNSNTLGLHNMNGLSADDKRTCALNDMNAPVSRSKNASLQDMNAANEQPDMACSITNMNFTRTDTPPPRLYAQACRRGYISVSCSRKAMQKEAFHE